MERTKEGPRPGSAQLTQQDGFSEKMLKGFQDLDSGWLLAVSVCGGFVAAWMVGLLEPVVPIQCNM